MRNNEFGSARKVLVRVGGNGGAEGLPARFGVAAPALALAYGVAKSGEDRLEILGEGLFKGHRLAGDRVRERQPPRVQKRPIQRDAGAIAAVRAIAHNRMSDGGQVHPNLVRTARL